MSPSFDLDPVDALSVGSVGPPGRRQFFIRARGQGEDVTLGLEKYHLQGLASRIRDLLEQHGFGHPEPEADEAAGTAAEPALVVWKVGELGLGYHEVKLRFVIVAREAVEGEEAEGAVARLWVEPQQLRDFLKQANAVLKAGRPLCPRCGLPVDPSGHPCPAFNGLRPIF